MRIVGHRTTTRPLSFSASADFLREGARFNEETQRLTAGLPGLVPKGVYRFNTHEEANQFDLQCLAERMVKIARQRNGQGT